MANKGKNMPNTKRRTLLSLVKDKFSQLTDKEKEKLLETNIVGDFREFKYVKVGDLHLPFYQRQDLRLNLLFGALTKVGDDKQPEIDLDFLGFLKVSPNLKDGGYDLDDGQRRTVLILLKRYINEQTTLEDLAEVELPCAVSKSEQTYVKKAKNFYLDNGGANASKPLDNEEQFDTMVEFEDSTALYYKEMLEEAGLHCGRQNKDKSEREIKWKTMDKALTMGARSYRKDKNHEDKSGYWFKEIADLFKDTWGPGQFDNQLFNGFMYLVNHPHYQAKFLSDKKDKAGKTMWDKFKSHIKGLKGSFNTPNYYVNNLERFKVGSIDWSVCLAHGIIDHFCNQIGFKGVYAKTLRAEIRTILDEKIKKIENGRKAA